MGTITFQVFPPPVPLARDVECIRVAKHTGTDHGLEVKVCPNGLPGLVFNLSADGTAAIESIMASSFTVTDLPILFLHGQGAVPSIMRFKRGSYTTIQIVLKPHALYSLFGMDASVFDKGLMQPEEFGMRGLTDKVLAARDDAARISLLCTMLIGKLKQAPPRDELIEKSLEFIHANIVSVTAGDVLDRAHLSERQFQKRFTKVVGMPTQLYIRIKRVNEALRLIDSGDYEKLSDVAHALNFYDQSHFIREMKTFSWVTPKDISQNVNEFHQDAASASYL
jgi:AraC-like DNA-binding protein